MPLADPKKLSALLKDGAVPSPLLLWGEDGVSILRWQRKIAAFAVTAFADFNSYRCDGRAPVDVDALADSARSLPMMAPRRLAFVDDLNPELLSSDDLKKLEQLFRELPEETLLLITVRSCAEQLAGKKQRDKKEPKGKKLLDLCQKYGTVTAFPRPDLGGVAQLAMDTAKRAGSSLERQDARLLAEYCLRDPQRAVTEAEKLAAYAPGGITAADIRLLVTPGTEARVFDLAGKIAAQNYTAAMAAIGDLIFLREEPVTILSILSMAFVDMYRAAVARREGIPPEEAKKALGYYGGSAYRYDKGVENQRRFSVPMLRDILALLAGADSRMKQSGPDPRVVLEATVAEIFRRMEGT